MPALRASTRKTLLYALKFFIRMHYVICIHIGTSNSSVTYNTCCIIGIDICVTYITARRYIYVYIYRYKMYIGKNYTAARASIFTHTKRLFRGTA